MSSSKILEASFRITKLRIRLFGHSRFKYIFIYILKVKQKMNERYKYREFSSILGGICSRPSSGQKAILILSQCISTILHGQPRRQGDPRIVGFKSQLNYRKIVFSSLRLLIPTTGRRISRARRGSSGPPHCYPPRATINRVPLALAPTTHGRIPTN